MLFIKSETHESTRKTTICQIFRLKSLQVCLILPILQSNFIWSQSLTSNFHELPSKILVFILRNCKKIIQKANSWWILSWWLRKLFDEYNECTRQLEISWTQTSFEWNSKISRNNDLKSALKSKSSFSKRYFKSSLTWDSLQSQSYKQSKFLNQSFLLQIIKRSRSLILIKW